MKKRLHSLNLAKLITSNIMLVIGIAIVTSMILVASVEWNVWYMHGDFKKVVSTEFLLQLV